MAGDDRTEKATPKRRDEARKEGNVARSMELNSALGMLAGFLVLSIWGPKMWTRLADDAIMRFSSLDEQARTSFGVSEAMDLFFAVVKLMTIVTAPVILVLAAAGVLASVIQVRPRITPEVLKPRFKRLDPIAGMKQKFSMSTLFELGKNILKLVVVGAPAAQMLWTRRMELLSLGDAEPIAAGVLAIELVIGIGLRVSMAYIVLAICDWAFQRWRHEKGIRMTKQEVKQEMRQQDIAPEMKAAQRRRQRDAARRRMLADVPHADVIITNPTHYSIALAYDTEQGAPKVLAKGVDLLALRIREIAEESGVTRVENRPLARELYSTVEVGHFIPAEMYAAVAEVLAFVYRAEGRQGAGQSAGRRTAA